MKLKLLTLVATALVLAAGVRARAAKSDKEDAADRDAKQLQGTWILESAERRGGEKAPEAFVKSVKLRIDGMKFTMTIDKQTKSGTIKLSPSKKPKQIDMISDGKTSPAIYELDKNTLKLVVDAEDKTRAKDFAPPGKESSHMLLVFKRK